MKKWTREVARCGNCKRFIVAAMLLFFGFSCSSDLRAEEPAEAFLAALRQRGYFDEALLYLEHATTSKVVPESFQKTIPFERAQILIDSIRQVRDPKKQESRLDEADKLLARYAASVTDPVKATDVLKRRSLVKYIRGRNYLTQSGSKLATGDKKKQLAQQARQLLGDAVTQYQEIKTSQADQIENFVIDPEDPDSNDKLAALRGEYVRNRLRIPEVMETYALTFDEESSERKAEMLKAATEFEGVAKAYDEKFGEGRMAKAFSARCYQQAGETSKAGDALKEVFEYPAPSARLQRAGLLVGIDTWPKLENYPADVVIRAAETPLGLLDRKERRSPTWMRVRLELARAKRVKSEQVKSEDSAMSRKLATEGSRLAREVARSRTQHSEAAAKLMNEWGVSITAATVSAEPVEPPKSFVEAKDRGKAMVADLEAMLKESAKLEREVARLVDGVDKDNKAQQLQESRASIEQRADATLELFRMALKLAQSDTPRVDRNNIRYLQAYCYFAKGRHEEAAVIGRFLLRKYPTIDWSQQAAGLMVRSYEKLYDAADPADKASVFSQVSDGATLVMDRWPDGAGVASAAVAATRVAVLEKRFDQANDFFDRIPVQSTARAALASRLGQQVWSSRKNADEDTKKQLAAQAKNFLDIAVGSKDPAEMDFYTAVSALYLVDANRELGDIDEAVGQAESLLGAIKSNKALGSNARFRQSAYNATLNTYLAAMRGKSDKQAWIDKSKDVIGIMSVEAAGDPNAQKMVSAVYRKIAGDLRSEFEALPSLAAKQSFADSLKSFFGDIGSVAKDAKTRLWAGSTLLGIAEMLALEGGAEKAKEISSKAISSLESAREAGFGNDPKLELNYQHQLALAQRGSGQYDKAVASFQQILEKSSAINVQMDAAKTLHIWGVNQKDPQALTRAIMGTGKYRDPETKKEKKRIWGWKTITSITRKNEKYRAIFREALYYSILGRFRYGQIKQNKKAVESALKELENALKRFDDLDVGAWKTKYDQLHSDLKKAAR